MDFPKYPWNMLCRACDAFALNWKKCCQNNPVASRIREMHIKFPPQVRLLNTEPYPFEEANAFYPHSDVLLLRGRTPNIHCKRPISIGFGGGEVQCKRKLTDPELSKITEKVINIESSRYAYHRSLNQMKLNQSETTFVYSCDACESGYLTHAQAMTHGAESHHQSLSQYTYSVDEDSDSGGESKVPKSTSGSFQLTKPRDIFISKESEFEWKAGDSVIFCPTCHLITPDKIVCAFHHQTAHPDRKPIYSLGQVLEAHTFSVELKSPRCERCCAIFSSATNLISHWNENDLFCSPFRNVHFCLQTIHLECMHCNLQRDRTILRVGSQANSSLDGVNSRATSTAHSVGVNFVRHVLGHCKGRIPFGFRLAFRFRFISIEAAYRKEFYTLPPYALTSTEAILLHSYQEAMKVKLLLKAYRNSKKSMLLVANAEIDRLRSAIAHEVETSSEEQARASDLS